MRCGLMTSCWIANYPGNSATVSYLCIMYGRIPEGQKIQCITRDHEAYMLRTRTAPLDVSEPIEPL